jgi:16S rRNA (cytidine1402-2'-O)-methyltransferase
MKGLVYLIPIAIAEDGYDAIPNYITEKINQCEVFFAENIRTARRAFKKIDPKFDIDSRTWIEIGNNEEDFINQFSAFIQQEKNIGIVSESGCPGIADPGQRLVEYAQKQGTNIVPLSGPNSILLTLMASGMNGQGFSFNGYLPIEKNDREKKIKELETRSVVDNHSQIFIETPYRNNQLVDSFLNCCRPDTKLCIGLNLTSINEWVKTMTITDWKKNKPTLPKEPAIFIMGK